MTRSAPFPYFGGKSRAASLVWDLLGDVPNYVEPFFGSGAVLLRRPQVGKIETVNDRDGFIANFWRAIAADPDAVALAADWPVNEIDLEARHGWLIQQAAGLREALNDPDYYDAKIAGWWCWGACAWIGHGWCGGEGPWQLIDGRLVNSNAGQGINRQLPHLSDAGRGEFIREWFGELSARLRAVRVICGDWERAVTDSVTDRHGLTGIFLDPPYTVGNMEYGAGGMGEGIADAVREWCVANGGRDGLRIVLCGHAGEHDALLSHGWTDHRWTARKGYATGDNLKHKGETVWASPACISQRGGLFAEVAS